MKELGGGTHLKSEVMADRLKLGFQELRVEMDRELDDVVSKIDDIIRTELVTFDKLREATDKLLR